MLHARLIRFGLHQNRDKQESMVRMQGAGSVAQYRQLRSKQHVLPGRTAQSARYLGPHLNTANTFGAELKQRAHAMIRAFKETGGCWFKAGIPYTCKRSVLICKVGNA
eukprot:3656117-Pyramimonas_sp.AAC.1